MRILIPCKTRREMEMYFSLFIKSGESCKKGDECVIRNGGTEIVIYVHTEEKICAVRADAVLVNNSFSVDEWRNSLLPLIVCPVDLRARMRNQNMDEIKKSLLGDE